MIEPLGGTTPPNAKLSGLSCKSGGEARPSSALRHSRWVLSSHPFSLGAFFCEHDLLAVGADGDVFLLIPQHGFYDRLSGVKLSPMTSRRTRCGSSHAGQNSSECCAVSSSSSQWWHVLVTESLAGTLRTLRAP